MMADKQNKSVFRAFLAAALYAISAPASKILLQELSPTMMASLLYLGAGTGMSILGFFRKKMPGTEKEMLLTKKELPFIAGMVALDITAPIFLMIGLTMTTAANASLLNNFEIVATSLIALVMFKEVITKRLWFAIGLITISSIFLSLEGIGCFSFSYGSVFVLLACTCWGFENNCTRMLSGKDPLETVVIKGFGSGLGSFIIALYLHEVRGRIGYILAALLLGFVAYGLSIYFYVYAQRELGAAKTSTCYAIAPFIGVALSFVIFKETITASFVIALVIMMIGAYFASTDNKAELSPK